MRDKQGQYRRERPSAPPKKRRSGALVTIAALAIFAFGLLGMIGLFGGVVRDFMQGAFGFMGYPFFALALLATLFKKALRRRLSRRVVIYGVLLLLVFLAWLQVLTSHAEFAAISEPVSFSAYLNVCYDACLGTSGGVVIGWMVFPLLSLMGKYSAIPLAVLFFVLLFFALLPWMRSAEPARKEGEPVAPRRSRSRAEKRAASAGEGRLVLFVDRVRPGQRDARKLKFRGIFSKKSPEPQFFDLTDARPLSAPDGMIPKARPERYDLRQPAENKYAEDFYDDYAPVDPIPSREPARAESRRDEIPAVSGDLPPFIRRYREESAEAVDHLSASRTETESDHSALRDGASSSSASERVAPPAFDVLPKTTIRKPKASVSDIISDVSDLERLRASEPKAPARAPFLGELPDPVPPRTAPSPVASATERVAEVRQPPEEPVTARQEPAPVAPTVEPIRPEPAPARSVTEPTVSTITPREASAIRPVEQPEPAPIPRRTPIAPVTEPSDPETELPIRTRKPRSDIGGTHRPPETVKPVVPSYIPPNRVEQPDIEQVMREAEEAPARPYSPPPVTLLKELPPIADAENIEEMGDALIAALRSFNIESTIVDHKTGPTFTRFAVTLPDNMSVNKLTPLEKDIKRKLMVDKKDIRIIPSVPNFDAIGIEVPNKKVSPVGLRSIINSPVFEEKNKLMFAIGVDVSGSPVYGDLLGMPHLLVAGSTGSGKSVCLNVLITSIMYHYSPEFVRFIMIDPKKVELSCYSNMPHMLIPSTITEPDKAINALSWLVDEMERRYDLLKNAGVKGIETYNAKMERTGGKKLYYIVFIIDEMADLMYTARKEIDEKVNRIAAKARAAGINLILATQRPSVDVITGTIKNNMRAKIGFKVGSFVDSKTIMDRGGAESLFGKGDMLYMASDGGEPTRLQGPFISEDEIDSVVTYVKAHNDCRFDYSAEKSIYASKDVQPSESSVTGEDVGDGEDDLFVPALDFFIESGQASISKLQIKFRIGYGRAARIVAMMEERDYLTGAEGGNKTRSVKITREEFEALYCSDNNGSDDDGGEA